MRKIILMMPVSAGSFTLIIGTPAGRSPMLTFRHRPRPLWPRLTGAPEETRKDPPICTAAQMSRAACHRSQTWVIGAAATGHGSRSPAAAWTIPQAGKACWSRTAISFRTSGAGSGLSMLKRSAPDEVE